jgi:hypothetical protein
MANGLAQGPGKRHFAVGGHDDVIAWQVDRNAAIPPTGKQHGESNDLPSPVPHEQPVVPTYPR